MHRIRLIRSIVDRLSFLISRTSPRSLILFAAYLKWQLSFRELPKVFELESTINIDIATVIPSPAHR